MLELGVVVRALELLFEVAHEGDVPLQQGLVPGAEFGGDALPDADTRARNCICW